MLSIQSFSLTVWPFSLWNARNSCCRLATLRYLEVLHFMWAYFAVLTVTQVNSQRLDVIIFYLLPAVSGLIWVYTLWMKRSGCRQNFSLCPRGAFVVSQIAGYVNQPMVDVSILQRSLAILESMVLNSHSLYHRVAQEITVGQLIGHLQVWAHTHAQGLLALWIGGGRCGIILAIAEILWCAVLELNKW